MKKNNYNSGMMGRAKSQIKTGIVTMTGMSAMGGIAGTPSFPAAGAGMLGTIGGGLNLANVGETAKTGMHLTKMFSDKKSKNSRTPRGIVNKFY